MSDGEIGMSDIHSCSYFCLRPACVLAQRDELRADLASAAIAAQQQAEPVASLMTNVQSGDVQLVWNDDGFSTLWHETILYKIGGSNGGA